MLPLKQTYILSKGWWYKIFVVMSEIRNYIILMIYLKQFVTYKGLNETLHEHLQKLAIATSRVKPSTRLNVFFFNKGFDKCRYQAYL